MLSLRIFFLLALWSFGQPLSDHPTVKAPMEEQIIIFYQAHLDQHFIEGTLPLIREYADENEMLLQERQVADGLPNGITSTPAVVYQNYRGRAIYSGRYTEFSTLRNFFRTSRIINRQPTENCKEEILTWSSGRMKILAPVKITPLQGQIPEGYQAEAFTRQAKLAIDQGMKGFKPRDSSCIGITDRQFYLDFHPYVDENNRLYLSVALFSQFSCITPVFERRSNPLVGKLDNIEPLFAEAGRLLEEQIMAIISGSTIGDAISPVPDEVARLSWEDLGLSLPPAPKQNNEIVLAGKPLPAGCQYAGPLEAEAPVLQFHFLEPLERYAGEVKKIKGQFQLNESGVLTSGSFEVATQSLTMGMKDLDVKVLKKYIKAFRYPKARFEFQLPEGGAPLEWGKSTQLAIPGEFELMKKKKPMTMLAQLQPVLGEDGKALLQVEASFRIDLRDFGIEGPDGPSPARETMQFYANFLMAGNSTIHF